MAPPAVSPAPTPKSEPTEALPVFVRLTGTGLLQQAAMPDSGLDFAWPRALGGTGSLCPDQPGGGMD